MNTDMISKIQQDKARYDYKKLSNKYPHDFKDYLDHLKADQYQRLPLKDKMGTSMVYTKFINESSKKLHIDNPQSNDFTPLLVNEIISTARIENIIFDETTVETMIRDHGFTNDQYQLMSDLIHGYDFIHDSNHHLDPTNLYRLYQITIDSSLKPDDRFSNGSYYRNDMVNIVGSSGSIHAGIDHHHIDQYMQDLFQFIDDDTNGINDFTKASIIHFYIGYIHPWFDGNGRMARLVHLWFLIQKRYPLASLLPFSKRILQSKNYYYKAYQLVETNACYSQTIDLSPFIDYFQSEIYQSMVKP